MAGPDLSDPKRALESIRWAHDHIRAHIHRTPILECRSLTNLAGVPLRLKCENLQRGGAFKVRGALTRTLALTVAERERGLITYSSGNHAQGVALAARVVGTRAVVVMPEDASPPKVEATRAYGAEVVLHGLTTDERRARAEELQAERELTMVPPFDDPWIICGQATATVEIMEEWPDAGAVFVPIGGGGLVSGAALAVRALSLGTRVIGVEPEGAARATASIREGRRVKLSRTDTVADGLRPLALGELNWDVIRRFVDEVVTVSEREIVDSVRLLLERAKLVTEPSGAVSVAAALREGRRFRGPIVALVSGGNMEIGTAVEAILRRA